MLFRSDKLREFIKLVFAEKITCTGDSAVAAANGEASLLFCINLHGPEFYQLKITVVFPDPGLEEKNTPPGFDGNEQ